MRKIIQITANEYLYALCNDGTAWERYQGQWHRVTAIPQPDLFIPTARPQGAF